jgi:peptide/nickel transport system ATP-binding protein/oligopeptide transport system ATP-binding protein
MSEPLLELRELKTHFFTDDGVVRAVDGVSYALFPGETLAVVGESGSGKSVTALSILRLVASPPGRIVGGSIRFRGRDLLSLSEAEMRGIRGREISMIFQEPMTSLNPVYTCGEQIMEVLQVHMKADRIAARKQAVELMQKVGIPAPELRVDDYPHQMSGGMRQRVMIAMALACRPAVLIADEPTTALDVTIQAQILDLLRSLRREFGMAVLLITHDLGVVAETADKVAVLYAGQVVEYAGVREVFRATRHPYTAGLLASLPRLGASVGHAAAGQGPPAGVRLRLRVIPGQVPDPTRFPAGCRFHPRCPLAVERCRSEMPGLRDVGGGHLARCHRAEEIASGAVDPVGAPGGEPVPVPGKGAPGGPGAETSRG